MKNRNKGRFLAVLLVIALMAGIGQVPLAEAATAIVTSGKLGEISWSLNSEGVLNFEGSGEFPAFQQGQVPWKNYVKDVKKVIFSMNSVNGGDISNYFYGCTKLESVNHVPDGVKCMDAAFSGCTALTSVGKIPDTVISMCRAFEKCKKLNQEITIPENVEKASGAFDCCFALSYTPVVKSEKIKDMSYMFRYTAITSAPHLSEAAEDLSYTFSWCQNMTTAPVIPDKVKYMDHTFEYCYELATAPTIPGNVESMSYGFFYCMSLVSPPNITSDKLRDMSGAFRQCYELLAAPVIPEGVMNIDYAFYDCQELRKGPDIPASVTNMSYCMAYCPEVCGTMTVYTVITNPDCYYRFAGDTAVYQEANNPAFLGGRGEGLKVNYVNNNKAYIKSYLSYGWNSGTLANYGELGKLSVGSMMEQSISSCSVEKIAPRTYNGSSQRPEPDIYYSSVKMKKGTDYTLTYDNNINAGRATMTITGKGNYTGRKIVEFEIQKAVFSAVKSYSYSGVYDGSPHSIAVTCEEGAVIEYGTKEGQYTTGKCPEYTLPGSYTTYFQVTKPNYETYTGQANVRIEEKELEVESEGFSGDYDGNPHSIRLEAEEGAMIKYGTKEGEYTNTICPSYINVGKYTVYYQVSKTGYTTYTGRRMVIIRRKQVEDVVFPEVSEMISGESLREAVLSFSYNQYGTFAWKTPEVVPEAGMTKQVLIFTPNDILNYDFENVSGYDEEEKIVVREVSVDVKAPEPEETPKPTIQPEETPEPTPQPKETPEPTPQPEETPEPMKQPEETPGATLTPVSEPEMTMAPMDSEEMMISEIEAGDEEPSGEKNSEENMEVLSEWMPLLFPIEHTQGTLQTEVIRHHLKKVRIKKIQRKKKKFYIRWEKIPQADGYQIICSLKKNKKQIVKKKIKGTVKTAVKWNRHKKYYVKVRAYTVGQGKKSYGAWSKLRCVRKA